MRNNILSFIKLTVVLAALPVYMLSCEDDDVVVTNLDSIDVTLGKESDMSIFKAAIKQAKLETFTQGAGPFTLFAPTDAAFTTAGITTASLPTIDSVLLTSILLYHFQNISRTSFEIPTGPNAPMSTISGFTSYSSKVGANTYLNGMSMGKLDIKCSNGIIHKINSVLFPPTINVLGTLGLNPNYKLMLQAINKVGGTTTTAYASNPITVFAVPNTALTAAGYDSTAIANANAATITTLSGILRYHVYTGRLYTPDMKAGNLRMVQGTNTVIGLGNPNTIKGTNNPAAFNMDIPNVTCSNGVLHAITGLLRP